MSTASDSESRWLNPPPARTAARCRARSPGSVLRVSRMRTSSPTAVTHRRVNVAIPEQCDKKVQRDALAEQHRTHAIRAAGRASCRLSIALPSVTSQSTRDRPIDLAVHLGGGLDAREHAGFARDERAFGLLVFVDARQ